MKKIIVLLLMAYLPAISQQVYVLNTKESNVFWKGKMWLSNGSHEGTIRFTSGKLTMDKDGKIIAANFEIDMNTIKSLDAEPGKDGLADHLKDPDFFDVKKFPKAFFAGTKISKTYTPDSYLVEGTLTIKGIKKKITFTTKLIQNKTKTTASAELVIQRSWWGVTYKSPDFLSSAKDEMIADDIPVKLNLVFGK